MFKDTENIDSIKKLLQWKGFSISYGERYFQHRLRVRMRRLGVHQFADYSRLLISDSDEIVILDKELTKYANHFRKNPDLVKLYEEGDDFFDDTENTGLISELLLKKGFNVSYRDTYFQRRLRNRMRDIGVYQFKNYYNLLLKSDNEVEFLKKNLSISVTDFYRDPDTYEFFEEIFRRYIKETVMYKKNPEIRIWSAGCAVGAEPYSIAIIVNETLGNSITDYRIKIYATDFNDDLLALAREGEYDEERLAKLPKDKKSSYFDKTGPRRYRISSTLQSMIEFSHLDLTANIFPFTGLDIIFCRNVLIYFDIALTKQLLEKFHGLLIPGGILVLGRTETIPLDVQDLFQVLSLKHRLYRKPVAGQREASINKKPVMKYACKYCGEVFHRLDDLKVHYGKHEEKKSMINCKICNKALKNAIRLKVHMRIAHGHHSTGKEF